MIACQVAELTAMVAAWENTARALAKMGWQTLARPGLVLRAWAQHGRTPQTQAQRGLALRVQAQQAPVPHRPNDQVLAPYALGQWGPHRSVQSELVSQVSARQGSTDCAKAPLPLAMRGTLGGCLRGESWHPDAAWVST